MYFLTFTDDADIQRWQLDCKDWGPVQVLLFHHGVSLGTMNILDPENARLGPDEYEWLQEELDDLKDRPGCCLAIEGRPGDYGSAGVPQRRRDDPFQRRHP